MGLIITFYIAKPEKFLVDNKEALRLAIKKVLEKEFESEIVVYTIKGEFLDDT